MDKDKKESIKNQIIAFILAIIALFILIMKEDKK
jgi:hypothetical protein